MFKAKTLARHSKQGIQTTAGTPAMSPSPRSAQSHSCTGLPGLGTGRMLLPITEQDTLCQSEELAYWFTNGCVTLVKLLNPLGPGLSHLQNGGNTGLPSRANERKHFVSFQVPGFKSKHRIYFQVRLGIGLLHYLMFRHHRCILVDSRESLETAG